MDTLTIENMKFYMNGEPFHLASGDMHYFRYYNQKSWERRLRLMKDFGLTCVQTYVPWNLHEPEKGQFCFDGNLDIEEFFRQCDSIGLKVLLRPSAYICSEWDFGGLPYWLLNDYDSKVRTTDEKFMKYVSDYYEILFKKIVPHLSTNGGPIIAMAVENEYGSYGTEFEYITKTKELYIKNGADVPLYCADGFEEYKMKTGSPTDIMTALDIGALTDAAMENIKDYQPNMPIYIAEFWGGKGQQFGGKFMREPGDKVAERYKELLSRGAYANFYMFCGGTNFGFMNGALEGRYRGDSPDSPNRYIPYATSYDVDAPVSENGVPTPKYYALKKVLCEKQGIVYKETKYEYRTQKPDAVTMTGCAPVFENLLELAQVHKHCGSTPVMESLNQAYGFILYNTHIPHTDNLKRNIRIYGLADRATIYGNGKYLGTYMRNSDSDDLITFYVPAEGMDIDILVENMGRICYGYRMADDRKGIRDCVRIGVYTNGEKEDVDNYKQQTGYDIYTLPMKDLSKLNYNPVAAYKNDKKPAFFKGKFKAEADIDTFVNMENWTKGNVWINGFNLGRYWSIGPQQTLYVPGELLVEENTIEIMEIHGAPENLTVDFEHQAILDSLEYNVDYNGNKINVRLQESARN